jgi:demethylspheroidene O-methyltransferase
MSRSQALVADEILDAYPVHLHARVMDVGGGEGTFLIKAAKCARNSELVLFDLPAMAQRATQRFAAAGLAGRASAAGGSFLIDKLPEGADLVTLIRVLHDHNDAAALKLLRGIRAVLPRGGTLLIAEPLKGTRGAEAVGDAYFEFYFLAMGQGRARTPEEIDCLLEEAGFARAQLLPTRQPLQTRLLATRPR